MLNNSRKKHLSPPLLIHPPYDLPNSKTPQKLTQSKSSKQLPDLSPKSKPSLQLKAPSRDSLNQEHLDFKLSEDFKKLNTFFIDPSLHKVFFKEFIYEETPSGLTSDRKDAQFLLEWLDFMLEKIQIERFDSPKQLFELANEIYSVCFLEVIRQVSAHCKERGYLLSRVWKAYQTLFEKALKISQSKTASLQENLNKKSYKVHLKLTAKIKNLEERLSTEINEKRSLQSELDSQSMIIKSKSEKEVNMLNNLAILQTQYKVARKELLVLKEDTRILKVRYENIGAEDEFNNVVKRRIIPKRFKKRTSLELEKEVSRDPLISNFLSDSDSDIFDKISRYGISHLEKSIEILFNQDDFLDKNTETLKIVLFQSATQTDIQDLCGESVGVKKRQNKLIYSNSIKTKAKPVYFPELRPYNQRAITVESNKIEKDPYSQELKKKHVRLRRMISIFKTVRPY